jgi:hypothetical protein
MNAPASSLILPAVGQLFAGGFFVGAYMHNGERRALVLAPKADGEFSQVVWNDDNWNAVPGALSFFDGLGNTDAMAEAGSELAKRIRALRIGGHEDWHLPALDQLELCYRHLKPGAEENYLYARAGINVSALPPTYPYTATEPAQTVIAQFRTGGELLAGMANEAFEEDWYWTSTQHAGNSDYAWIQNFGDGYQSNDLKDDRYLARAVRSVAI